MKPAPRRVGARRTGWRAAIAARWAASPGEACAFPDDDQFAEPDEVLHRAVTVEAPADLLWRWLCQLTAGPHSYDWLDNLGRRSPRHRITGLDRLEVGQRDGRRK